MEIVSTKIVNGKKMYLIDDTSNKLFANNGENVNPYYVPIQEINSSDNTKTKLTPKQELSKKEIQQLKTSPTAVQNIRDREKFEKEERLRKSESAYQKRIKTGIQSSQDLADEIGAIGDKISLQNIPKIGQYIPDILDVTGGIGSMASGLGAIPLNLNRGNYGQALLSVASPLAMGALAGIGNPNTGQFANNLINPFAGTGQIINKLGNKYLPNAYKLNPYAFKPNPEAFYRQVGKSAYDDAITKGKVFSKGQENMLERVPELNYLDEYNKSITLDKTGKFNLTKPSEAPFVQKGELFFPINRKPTGKGYKGTKYADAEYLLEGKLPNEAVLPRYQEKYFPTLEESSNVGVIRPEFNELNNFNVYKRDWLKGYKQIDIPKQQFKSEIDWAKWNKEIPNNPQLMKEYNSIEQTSKANGSWMKNPDGSAFQGSPEQFVQQNSENFKKAFPEGAQTTYRGTQAFNPTLSESLKGAKGSNFHITFGTSNESVAENYATHTGYNLEDEFQKIGKRPNYYHPDKSVPGTYTGYKEDVNPGMYQLAVGNDLKSIKADGMGKSWVNVENKEVLNWLKNKDPEIANRRVGSSYLPDKVMTDDIASYMVDKKIPVGKVTNVYDGADFFGNKVLSDVTMLNPTIARVKSLKYNNGMFDMTNPNIYKTIVGGLATGALGKEAVKKQEFGGKIKILKTKISNGKTLHLIDY